MIRINSFAIGNRDKSFVFNEFNDGINIIHSDDNNKGKTIVSQGIFYALGNNPIFPAGFEIVAKKTFDFSTSLEILSVSSRC